VQSTFDTRHEVHFNRSIGDISPQLIAKLWCGNHNTLETLASEFRAADNLFTLLRNSEVIEALIYVIDESGGINFFTKLVCKLQSNLIDEDHRHAETCALSMVCSMSLEAYTTCK
jgi:hypothetical protein